MAGVVVPKGAVIFCWLAAANRDRAQFPNPERFTIQRTPNKHVAFGYGIHFCLGAPLSRLEASVALPILLEQLPDLQRDRSKALEIYEGRALFGLKRLPVVFTPSVPAAIG
ncbi:MAG TPA: cytochrome P450 [Ktedonobacteraceae bacterium]|nr:cytochrome P450 [Ktedonobacteraceae bacterium]